MAYFKGLKAKQALLDRTIERAADERIERTVLDVLRRLGLLQETL